MHPIQTANTSQRRPLLTELMRLRPASLTDKVAFLWLNTELRGCPATESGNDVMEATRIVLDG